jgi:hypothetical protein
MGKGGSAKLTHNTWGRSREPQGGLALEPNKKTSKHKGTTGEMIMRKLNFNTRAAVASVAICLGLATSARADFEQVTTPTDDEVQIHLTQKDSSTTDTGDVNGSVVNITTSRLADFASGNATIKPVVTPGLITITYTPVDATAFSDVCFRGQLNEAGDITVTITDQHDSVFVIPIPKANQDFGALCFQAVAGTGETIKSVSITGDFKEQKQTSFSFAAAVPEPTTMIAGALLLLPFGASTMRTLRRNRKA